MIVRFAKLEQEDVFHPDHLLVPAAPSQDDTVDALCSLSSTREHRRALAECVLEDEDSVPSGLSKEGRCTDLLPPLTASPNLKHARTLHTMQLQSVAGASLVLAVTALSVGLGNGVAFGECPFSASA